MINSRPAPVRPSAVLVAQSSAIFAYTPEVQAAAPFGLAHGRQRHVESARRRYVPYSTPLWVPQGALMLA